MHSREHRRRRDDQNRRPTRHGLTRFAHPAAALASCCQLFFLTTDLFANGAVNVTQHHNDLARDGLYIDSAFTTAAAAGLTRDTNFDGTIFGDVYAQPLYIEGGPGGRAVIIAVTEDDDIFALDSTDGKIVWGTNVASSVPAGALQCGNLSSYGITGTPVVDLPSRAVFFDAFAWESSTGVVKHRIYSLNVDTGFLNTGWPVDVDSSASSANGPFNSSAQGQRAALTIIGTNLYVPYGGLYGDCGTYFGWVVGVPLDNPGGVMAWSTKNNGGGVWGVGGIASDGTYPYVTTGNTFGATTWSGGEAVIRLQPNLTLTGGSVNYWAPANWSTLDDSDTDLGGCGPLLLNVPGATPSTMVVALGKDGNVYLLNRSYLGGVGAPVAQAAVAPAEIIQAAATYTTSKGTYVVFESNWSLFALLIGPGNPPTITSAWSAYEGGSGSPFVTSTDGTNNVVVWGIGSENDQRLHGFDGDTGATVFAGGGANELMAGTRRYNTGIAARGRIFVANDVKVYAFKLPGELPAPTLTWNNPAPITYGAMLTSNQLNAAASVAGEFAYTPTNGAGLPAGTNTLSVIFTPADTTDYTNATATVSLVVLPETLTVTASNASRVYGAANPPFGGSITGVTNGDNISATYSTTAASSSPAGQYPIVPSLVDPDGALTNYTVTAVNGTLLVGQAGPVMTWNSPAPITYGTALSSAQLNATANVPGTFAYAPPGGTGLYVGTNTLAVIFTPTDAIDYTSSTDSVEIVVLPATLTVAANNATRAYAQANPSFAGVISGVANGDNITATYSTTATAASLVGTYPIVPALLDPNNLETNYDVVLTDGTLTVSPATPLVTWTNPVPIIYGDVLTSNQLNATAPVPGAFAYTPTNNTAMYAGTNSLSVIFTPADNVNYTSAGAAVSLVVLPAPLTVTASNATRPYGAANPSFTGSITGLISGDNISASFTTTASAGSTAGTYPIVPALVDPNNLQTNYTVDLVDGALTVSPAIPVLAWATPAPITYGTPLSATQLNATAKAPGAFAYNPANGKVLDVGTYALSVVFTPADSVDFTSATDSVSIVVLPEVLTVTANNASRAYGQPNPIFTGTMTGVTNDDNITAIYTTTATASSTVGTYPIVPALEGPNNIQNSYTIRLVSGMLTITQAATQLTWTNPAPIAYGTPLSSIQLNAAASAPGVFAYTPTNNTELYAGTNRLSAIFTPADAVDYSGASATVSLVVSPAPLTVTASDASRIYGAANPVFTGTITGLTNGDNISATFSTTATGGSAAGNYPIVPALVDPANLQTNYAIDLVDGTLIVARATPLLIWSNPAPIAYGTLLGSNQLNAAANVPGAFAYAPAAGSKLDVGANALSVIFTPSDPTDYKNASATVGVAVSPGSLTVMAANASRLYGAANPYFTGTISGLVAGDNISATFSTTATTGSAAGAYPIVPALVDPGDLQTNYILSLVDGTLTVGQVTSVISWTNPLPIIYGTPLSSSQLNATANVPGTLAYTPAASTRLDAGTNMLSVNFTPADPIDYTSAGATVSLMVLPAPLTVMAADASRLYGAANPSFTGTISGLAGGDNISATFSTTATTSSMAGLYPIVPTLVDPGDLQTNYTVSFIDGILTVGQVTSLIFWTNPAPIIYGAALTSLQLNATASVPGSLAYTPAANTKLFAGTNELGVIFTPADNLDYSAASAAVSLVVLPAPLTVTASNASRLYGTPNPLFTGTISGVTNGDNITATYSTIATIGSPAGMYPIVPALVDPGDLQTNYTVAFIDGILTVAAPPEIQSAAQSGNFFTFTWSAMPTRMYKTQSSTNLTQSGWSDLGGPIAPTNSTAITTVSITNSQTFYRVVLLP